MKIVNTSWSSQCLSRRHLKVLIVSASTTESNCVRRPTAKHSALQGGCALVEMCCCRCFSDESGTRLAYSKPVAVTANRTGLWLGYPRPCCTPQTFVLGLLLSIPSCLPLCAFLRAVAILEHACLPEHYKLLYEVDEHCVNAQPMHTSHRQHSDCCDNYRDYGAFSGGIAVSQKLSVYA